MSFWDSSPGRILRWLVAAMPDEVSLSFYSTSPASSHPVASWFASEGDLWHYKDEPAVAIAADICSDELDVLIDIDGLTDEKSCAVLLELRRMSGAPPTVSWMGFTPSGFCDYTIGDRWLMPDPSRYREEVLYMPRCYLAVGGYEVAPPQISRESLSIPDDAPIFYYGQYPVKHHPETMAAIRVILEAVPNAHLIFKQVGPPLGYDPNPWLNRIGLPDRVRLLPRVASVEEARGNLLLADVFLDSWPYNGTCTTLEALWCGCPVVSRYGQGWSARQGLTLNNAAGGQPAHSAFTGYVEAAIALGQDRAALDAAKMALITARPTAPLWDVRQFCDDFLGLLGQVKVKMT